MWAAIFLIFTTLGLLSAMEAVMTTRTTQGAIAWAVSLVAFPYLAVPAYWILGRSRFRGYVTARRTGIRHRGGEIVRRARDGVAPWVQAHGGRESAARVGEALAGMPTLLGNEVALLVDGEETFEDILRGVETAKEYVLFQFFIVRDDELGRRCRDTLIHRARAGVRVFFLYDALGSAGLPSAYLESLRSAGVKVSAFRTRKGFSNFFQVNFRNHRKVVVVDGRAAWIGGHNVSDKYLGKDPKVGHWRDTHVRIEGPAALGAQLSFFEDWRWAAGEEIELDWAARPAREPGAPVLIVPSGPADELETATLMFLHAIQSARDRLWIASPYFVPDESVLAALQLACLRGVDVRVLIPNTPDHLLAYLAAFSYFEDVDQLGGRFFRYDDGFLHEKVVLIDRQFVMIGTANFDNRSFRLNFEITAAVGGEDFVAAAEKMLTADFACSHAMRPGVLAAKPFWFRLAVRLARLTSLLE